MYQLAPNIDLLFSEAGDSAADRVRAAAAAGFDAVEMWGPTGKDIPALKEALRGNRSPAHRPAGGAADAVHDPAPQPRTLLRGA